MGCDSGAASAHLFRHPGNFPLDDLARRIGRHIPGADTGAAGRQDQIRLLMIAALQKGVTNERFFIGDDLSADHLYARGIQHSGDLRTAAVLALTAGAPVAHRDDDGRESHIMPRLSWIRR